MNKIDEIRAKLEAITFGAETRFSPKAINTILEIITPYLSPEFEARVKQLEGK